MNEEMFSPKMEGNEGLPEPLTDEEIEAIVINIDPEDMAPLPEAIKIKLAAIREKWEKEHKEGE